MAIKWFLSCIMNKDAEIFQMEKGVQVTENNLCYKYCEFFFHYDKYCQLGY